MAKRVAIDIGGTFTDFVGLDEETGEILLEKALTTPHNFAEGVINTISKAGADPREFRQFVHGTTVVINALTERKGAKVALITTKGFRDVLEIQRANRPDMYNLFYQKPKPFVPRRFRFEVRERVNFRGEVLQPLVEEDVVKAVEACKAAGIEAIAVCYIHAYAIRPMSAGPGRSSRSSCRGSRSPCPTRSLRSGGSTSARTPRC